MVKARQQAVERGERLQARAAKRLSKRSERLAQIDDVISNVASSSAPIRAAASANLNTASTSATYTHQPGEPSTATSGISSAPTIESTDAEDNAIRLIIYTTDGCISQNKNKTVSAAILEWLNDPSHTVQIINIYFETYIMLLRSFGL
jgi:hypothetical protein